MDLPADNDAIVKFGQCKLLRDLVVCFGSDTELFASATFRPWLRGFIKNGRVPDYVQVEFEALSPRIVEIADDDVIQIELQAIQGIDAGEAILLAAVYNQSAALPHNLWVKSLTN